MDDRFIWKIDLPDPGDLTWVELPGDWRIVAADMQGGRPVAWVEVQPALELVTRPVHVIGTGWPVPKHLYGDDVTLVYRATWQWGAMVWHAYEGVKA